MTQSDLARKLGIKPGMKVLVQDAPPHFLNLLGHLPNDVELAESKADGVDCVITFVQTKADVKSTAARTLKAVGERGLLWFAYTKKSGPLRSDLSRENGWEPLFEAGFDTVAQISIDETWTGFRLRPKHLVGNRSVRAN